MKLSKFNEWLTLIANFGIIVGIIFISVEIRQNNELLAAQDRYNRLDVATRGKWIIIENESIRDAIAAVGSGEMEPSQSPVFQMYWDNTFKGLEWTFAELPRDQLPTERWVKQFDDAPEIIDVWNYRKDEYNSEFVEFVEEYVISK